MASMITLPYPPSPAPAISARMMAAFLTQTPVRRHWRLSSPTPTHRQPQPLLVLPGRAGRPLRQPRLLIGKSACFLRGGDLAARHRRVEGEPVRREQRGDERVGGHARRRLLAG